MATPFVLGDAPSHIWSSRTLFSRILSSYVRYDFQDLKYLPLSIYVVNWASKYGILTSCVLCTLSSVTSFHSHGYLVHLCILWVSVSVNMAFL
jgi:hypothetical protein